MKNYLLIFAFVVTANPVLAQDSFSSVEERMTGREFMETGLSKLTENELDALNQWLRAHSVGTLNTPGSRPATRSTAVPATTPTAVASSAPPADPRGFNPTKEDKENIYSRIVGEFTGWDGETVFKLENGMVWKQAQSDKFFTKSMTNPEVEIKSTMFGGWRLSVEGYNKWVKVERIQ